VTRGRPPLPTSVKAVRGTLRKHRRNPDAPLPIPGTPRPPRWLGRHARAEWNRLVPQLYIRGLVETIDRSLLIAYATAYEELVLAQAELAEQGSTTVTARGAIVAHPALKRAQVARQQIHRFGVEFGIGPSARSRVSAAPLDPVAAARRRKFALLSAGSPEERAALEEEAENEKQARRFFGPPPGSEEGA